MKTNNKEFLNYLQNENINNMYFIKDLKINKKSFSVKIDKNINPFNNLFTKENLLNLLCKYLANFYKKDLDYIKYKYVSLNVSYI